MNTDEDLGFDVPAIPGIGPDASDKRTVVEDPPATATAIPAPTAAVADEELPPGLADAIELLQRVVQLAEHSDRAMSMQAARLKRIRAHVFALQQVPDSPAIDADTFLGFRSFGNINRLLEHARKDIANRLTKHR